MGRRVVPVASRDHDRHRRPDSRRGRADRWIVADAPLRARGDGGALLLRLARDADAGHPALRRGRAQRRQSRGGSGRREFRVRGGRAAHVRGPPR